MGGNVQDARREMAKTKEQLEEEKKISLSIRIKPLELDGMDSDGLKAKASELWEVIVKLETEKKSQRSRREAKKVGGSRKKETGDDEGTKGKKSELNRKR